jgi:hypothetical protein
MQPHPIVERIADLFLRPGHAPAQEGMDTAHRARLAWEWASDQWVLLASKSDSFWGWMSWHRVSDEVLALLKREDYAAIIARGDPWADLTQGPHVYISTAVVAPWAPPGTYWRLGELVCEQNADAKSICAHLRKRDGRVFWKQRSPQRYLTH